MPLSIFGFQALWSPYLIGIIVCLIIVYFLVTVVWRKHFKVSESLKKSEVIYFLIGMITFYIIKGSPVDVTSLILFTMHMVQMVFLLFVLPIFIIMGIPWWIWKLIIEAPVVGKIFKYCTLPVVSVLVFTFTFSIYHIPSVFDTIKTDSTFHGLVTLVLFLSAFFMYWPLVNTVPGQPQMKGLYKIGYIIATAIAITPACAIIVFSKEPLYSTYTDGEMWLKAMALCVPVSTLSNISITISGPELFTNLSPISDQQMGGVLMKIMQEIILGTLLVIVFRQWWRDEHVNEEQITENALKEFQAKKREQQY
ncbi:putative membrane protein [Ureibacillus xyleni]|uniref:Putative membrane protein n=1 Tax=Ureibacillus xyleni TaxID=614648 RepID=A0A285TI69_9BACL|nr:cytochrome c oxidase assembly factor CtaG [Ureibacillus xyleni]SOC21773.1 putative membrane protein [Ureibacillus xyleni]